MGNYEHLPMKNHGNSREIKFAKKGNEWSRQYSNAEGLGVRLLSELLKIKYYISSTRTETVLKRVALSFGRTISEALPTWLPKNKQRAVALSKKKGYNRSVYSFAKEERKHGSREVGRSFKNRITFDLLWFNHSLNKIWNSWKI